MRVIRQRETVSHRRARCLILCWLYRNAALPRHKRIGLRACFENHFSGSSRRQEAQNFCEFWNRSLMRSVNARLLRTTQPCCPSPAPNQAGRQRRTKEGFHRRSRRSRRSRIPSGFRTRSRTGNASPPFSFVNFVTFCALIAELRIRKLA